MNASGLRSLVAFAVLVGSALSVQARTADVVRADRAAALIEVSTEEFSTDGTVCGTVVNKSDHPVRDVQLMIRHRWLWNDERNPGKNSPARADHITLAEEIPPGGSAPFNYCADRPLPSRSDGHFDSSVELISYTEVGPAPVPAVASACQCDSPQR